jgi:hypothetical protein
MQIALEGDAFGRVVGTIAHKSEHAMVTGSDAAAALAELESAVDSALKEGLGECFWHESAGDYRWLFRKEGAMMRIVILWSIGTITGWEHRFWAECDANEFRDAMQAAIEGCRTGSVTA